MYKRNFLDYIILFFKGLAMGTANKIPGVSGGMIALVTGFYEEQIYSFQKFNTKALKLLSKGRFQKFFDYINFKFLFTVNIGSISAFFTISLLIDYMIRSKVDGGLGWITEVWGYFFGLILGSIYYVILKIKKWDFRVYLGIFVGAGLGLYISFLDPLLPNDSYWFIFLCGIIGVSGMTLPGFSGSFILIILGNYNLLMVDAVKNLFYTITAIFQGDWDMLGTANMVEKAARIRLLKIVGFFATGSLFGMISFSKVMGYLLRHYHDIVLGWLIGFIIGSLGASWPWKSGDLDTTGKLIGYTRHWPNNFGWDFIIQLICVLVGIITIYLIIYFEKKVKQKK